MIHEFTLAEDMKIGKRTKTVYRKAQFDLAAVTFQQLFEANGNIDEKHSLLCVGEKQYSIKGNYHELIKLNEQIKVKGFRK